MQKLYKILVDREKGGIEYISMGMGKGYSVLDWFYGKVCPAMRSLMRIKLIREEDVAVCYCDSRKAREELVWKVRYGIEEMCRNFLKWKRQNLDGYGI